VWTPVDKYVNYKCVIRIVSSDLDHVITVYPVERQ
jgi:hypothetical protein